MDRLIGYATEDMASVFIFNFSSKNKVLTIDISSDTSDGFDHSIYFIQIMWGDSTFNAGNVEDVKLTTTHPYSKYGTYEINVFLVSSYQNTYGHTYSWTLTENEPEIESSESSGNPQAPQSSDESKPSSESFEVPPSPPVSQDSSSKQTPSSGSSGVYPSSSPSPSPSPSPSSGKMPPVTSASSINPEGSFSKGDIMDGSSSGSSINIGWVALIFIVCIVVLIGGMFLLLKLSSKKKNGARAYNELELEN